MFIDGDTMYFGNDRLPLVEAALQAAQSVSDIAGKARAVAAISELSKRAPGTRVPSIWLVILAIIGVLRVVPDTLRPGARLN